jgi:[ribosomal protein S5]-alanine N-acetyltransferase
MPIQPIESARLRLTSWRLDDLADAQRIWGDPEVMRYVGARRALTRDEVLARIEDELARERQYGVQYWKVSLKTTGETIGCCGLRPYLFLTDPAEWRGDGPPYELGYQFTRAHWGHGYAQEAARAAIDYAFREMRLPKMFAGHHPENVVSAAVLQKLGFRRIADEFYPPAGEFHPSYALEAPKAMK